MESFTASSINRLQLYSRCCSHLLPPKTNSDEKKKKPYYNYNYNYNYLLRRNISPLPILSRTRTHCGKMYVPGFGEASPEAKGAAQLHNFFTYIAVRIVCAQLQSYNTEAYEELMEFLSRNSLDDGDKFCATLMRESSRHQNLALRILEVRAAYCKRDFEWDNLKRLAAKKVDHSNTKLMRDYVLETTSSVDIIDS